MFRSRYSQVLTLVCAILAFAPVLAVDYLIDAYVRSRETAKLQESVSLITRQVQGATEGATAALRRILADSPSLCTPTFASFVLAEVSSSLQVKDVLVESADGVQYCNAFGTEVRYVNLSQPLSISGRTETVTVVELGELTVPALKLTQSFGTTRRISAFVPVLPHNMEAAVFGLRQSTAIRLVLTNGTVILEDGDLRQLDPAAGREMIAADAFAGQLPLRVEAAVPFAVVRADYADLDVGLTIVAAITSGAFLLMALHYVRRTQMPAFDLERAIAQGQLKPYYQPVVNLKTGRLSGCEVLIRWEKRNGEIVPPSAFIDYAEVTGLAIPMTLSLMQQVKSDLWQLCEELPDLRISINLFEGHFRDDTIIEDVQAIFADTPISYRQLVFEITERRPLSNSLQANSVIAGLHALGCKLAMDDLGTGHSNLEYMQTLGVDMVKLDRVFVDMVKPDTAQVPVLDGLIAMARELKTEVIAEGVETMEQAAYLRSRGVFLAQGFLFAPALKAKQFREVARAINLPAPAEGSEPSRKAAA